MSLYNNSNFVDSGDLVVYTKEQVIKLFENYNYNIEEISKNFYKNYVDSMYSGFFSAPPPKSYTKQKELEALCTSCLNLKNYKNNDKIIDITK